MHLSTRGRSVVFGAFVCFAVLALVSFLWVWIGTWGLGPDRYDRASDWWTQFALPRAARSLTVGVPIALASAVLMNRQVRRNP